MRRKRNGSKMEAKWKGLNDMAKGEQSTPTYLILIPEL
jgi:hypothetical protein